jgi:hypothetical protein
MITVDNFPRAVCRTGAVTVLLLAMAAPGAMVKAGADTDALSLVYDIYVAGKSVYRISYDASLSAAAYKSAVDMAPTGVGKLFTDFRLNMSTQGGVTKGKLKPEDFTLKSSKNDEEKSVQMTWTAGRLPEANRTFKLSPPRAAAVEKALAPAIPDPLTAILRHSLENTGMPCDRTERVYNGLEVYDLTITLLGKSELDAGKDSVYRGPAFKCRVVLAPIAGYSDKKMRKYLKQPPTYAVWFAPVLAPELGKSILVPVAATGRAAGLNFTIAVSSATLGGRALAAVQ